MTTDSDWGDWIEHHGRKCPIPKAKAGEYVLRYRNGVCPISTDKCDAKSYDWGEVGSHSIVAYRIRRPAQPAPDLAAVAAEMARAMDSAREYVADAVRADGGIGTCDIEHRWMLEAIDAALSTYRATIGQTGGQDARD